VGEGAWRLCPRDPNTIIHLHVPHLANQLMGSAQQWYRFRMLALADGVNVKIRGRKAIVDATRDLLGDPLSDQVAHRARSRQGLQKDNVQPTGSHMISYDSI
jgi:hypothetical protein